MDSTPEVSSADTADLLDPIGALVAEEAARRWIQIAQTDHDALRAAMAEQESLLRRDGGASWAVAMMSRKMTHYLLESVAPLLKQALPLPTAVLALEVVETGARGGYDDHLTALMAAVLSTDTDRIEELIRQAADDSFALRDQVRLHIRTALLAAAGDPEVVVS